MDRSEFNRFISTLQGPHVEEPATAKIGRPVLLDRSLACSILLAIVCCATASTMNTGNIFFRASDDMVRFILKIPSQLDEIKNAVKFYRITPPISKEKASR